MLRLLRLHPYLLSFCVLTAAASGPGQTYFVSLFVPLLREELGLSRSAISAVYSAVTLISACLVPLLGRLLDRASPRAFSAAVACALGAGLLLLGRVQGTLSLFAALLLIRFFGQSGHGLLATTTAARRFAASRGTALGLTVLGFPLAEMTLPAVVAALLAALSWRSAAFWLALLPLALYLPAAQLLLRASAGGERPEGEGPAAASGAKEARSWRAGEVLRDARFALFLAAIFVPPFVNTAVFFHQGTLLRTKAWPAAALPAAIFAFGLCRAIGAAGIGPLVDRAGARRLFGWHLLPTAAGLLLLAWGRAAWTGPAAFALNGLSVGMTGPVRGALFAEVYGTRHLGAINGIGGAWAVFSTAAAPVAFGVLLDRGVSWTALMAACAAGTVALGAAGWAGGRLKP